MNEDGIWAELYKPKSIEELATDFRNYSHASVGSNLMEDFKNFLTKNKSELIEVLKNLPE